LLNHSNHVVLRQGEALQPMAFESDEAREIYENFVCGWQDNDNNQTKSSFGIPFIIGTQRSRKLAENAVRNDASIRFDRNLDGIISDQEAAVFGSSD